MKLVIALGIGFGVIFLISLLRGIFSKPSVPVGPVVKLEEPGVPWFLIGLLRLLRVLVGILALLVGLLTLKSILFGYVRNFDNSSTMSGWMTAFVFILRFMPLIVMWWFADVLKDKINLLYRNGAKTSKILIATCWDY